MVFGAPRTRWRKKNIDFIGQIDAHVRNCILMGMILLRSPNCALSIDRLIRLDNEFLRSTVCTYHNHVWYLIIVVEGSNNNCCAFLVCVATKNLKIIY